MSASPGSAEPACRDCRYFNNAAAVLEATFPGMTAMGSAFGSVRAGDGLCAVHGRYLAAGNGCASFAPLSGVGRFKAP